MIVLGVGVGCFLGVAWVFVGGITGGPCACSQDQNNQCTLLLMLRVPFVSSDFTGCIPASWH